MRRGSKDRIARFDDVRYRRIEHDPVLERPLGFVRICLDVVLGHRASNLTERAPRVLYERTAFATPLGRGFSLSDE